MSATRHLGLTALAAVLTLGIAPVSAAATTTATPDQDKVQFSRTGSQLSIKLVPQARNGTIPDLTGAEISATAQTAGGTPVPLELTVPDTGAAASVQTVMLTFDVSGSMNNDVVVGEKGSGKRITAAKRAVTQFLNALPATSRVGLVTFGNSAELKLAPTTDHGLVDSEVQRIQIGKDDTHLYSGVSRSLAELGKSTGFRSILVLSDGKPEGDEPLKGRTENALVEAKEVALNAIAFGQGMSTAALDSLVQAGSGGAVRQAGEAEELASAFALEGASVSNSVTRVVKVPPALAGQDVTVVMKAVKGTDSITARAVYPFPAASVAGTAASVGPMLIPDAGPITWPVLIAALAALFLGLTAIVAIAGGVFINPAGHQSEVMRRLSIYTVNARDPRRLALTESATTSSGGSPLRRGAVDALRRLLRGRELDSGLDERLDAAGVPLRTAEWMLVHIASSVGAGLVFLLLGRGRLVAGVVGVVIGFTVPWMVLSIRTSRRRLAFLAQLPDTLQALASSLRTGYSLPQAMDAVVKETSPPMSTEFNRSLIETRLGMAAEDALDGIADRTASKDFSWIVIAIRIQRQVGGNLAELLGSVAETLRERERLRGQVRALSAEGRLSAWILGLLPVVFTAYLMVARPEYLSPMFHTPMGVMLLIVGGVFVVLGALWMRKLVVVEV